MTSKLDTTVYNPETKTYNHEAITPEFLTDADGKVVWMRDDYLMCMGLVHGTPYYDFLAHVDQVKTRARENGHSFTA